MLAVHLALLFVRITLCNGVLTFLQKPDDTVYLIKGSNAVFVWDYRKTDGIESVSWRVYNKTQGAFEILRVEDENGTRLLVNDPTIPPAAYVGRLERNGTATLIIKDITFEDSTRFKIKLSGKPGVVGIDDNVDLVVTGEASVRDPVQFAELGTSVTCTCNATDVPRQNIKWKKQGQEVKSTSDTEVTFPGAGSLQLTLKSISVADHGYYMCEVIDSFNQTSSASCYVQELLPVKQDDMSCPKRSYTVAVGEQLSICCPVSGYPPPEVTWEKNGAQLQKGENTMYTITTVKDEDFGNYSCSASDGKSSIGPFDSSVTKMAKIPGTPINGTVAKAAKLEWEHQKNAEFYVVKISGEDIRDDYLIGTQTSLEFHFNALVMKKPGERPKETQICANVTAMNEAGVVGKTPTCQYITIKSSAETISCACFLLVLTSNLVW